MVKKAKRSARIAAADAAGAAPAAPAKKSKRAAEAADSADGGKGAAEKMQLLGGEAGDEGTLKVSSAYAKRYNERKDREELTRARRILADEDLGDSDSDTEPEDESAELLTGKIEGKIFETLNKIRSKDPSIYDKSKVFFDDEDFEESHGGAASSSSAKGTTYKDFLRDTLLREGADAIAREEDEMEARRRTPKQEEEDLRKSIISAAKSAANDDDGGDDDLFTLKQKTPEERRKEDERFKAFSAKKEREKKARTGEDYIARYWEGEDLDDNEKFLRDYIMQQSWKETVSMQPKDEETSDNDEESHLEEQDEFEKEYNFRFEMEGGHQIQGHKRFQESSVRERSDKRKRQRQQRTERKDAEKIRRTEELKRLKNLKKQEIMRRLKQLQEVTGNDELPLGTEVLDADFDPDEHDRVMAGAFGDGYEEQDEALDEDALLRAPAGCDDLDVSADASRVPAALKAAGRAGRRRSRGRDSGDDAGEGDGEGDGDEDGAQEGDGEAPDPEEWWMCDECQKGIPGGKKRFDCSVCENYTLCVKCFRIRRHPHKFMRRRVPEACMPPEDFKGADPNRENVSKMMDEYFQLDYEDIIGGDLPTRFKYTKVTPNDCGLTTKEILEKEDKELNRVIPLKKLRTYRTDDNKVRREAAWKWRQQARAGGGDASKGSDEATKAAGSSAVAGGRISAQRLAAYNLQADRKHPGKGRKKAKGQERGGRR